MDRKRLGLVYFFGKGWLGGLNYAHNLVKALDRLSDERKPLINVYCPNSEAFLELRDATSYPYLEMSIVKRHLYKQVLRKLLSYVSKEAASNINMFRTNPKDEILYPLSRGTMQEKLVCWRPDFQEKYFPEYFTKKEIERRDREIVEVCSRNIPIVFSSYDSQNDFFNFFPLYKNNPTFVIHFAVVLPRFDQIAIETLKKKFGIRGRYLFVSNQFWQHKNHLFLFRSYSRALDSGLDLDLVCTGNLSDYRNPSYIYEIKSFLDNSSSRKRIHLLGIVDKLEVLCLMKNSYAVVQPSLFEGWNTTVEECKAMNKFVFLSNLSVHHEQIKDNVCFFDPRNEDDLVNKLLNVKPTETPYNYSEDIINFAEGFMSLFDR